MPVEKIAHLTYLAHPVEFSSTLESDEIIVSGEYPEIETLGGALIKPVPTKKPLPLLSHPFVRRIRVSEREEGCVLPSSWIERIERWGMNKYGMPYVVSEKAMPDYVSNLFRYAEAVILNAELNFLNDWKKSKEQDRFYDQLKKIVETRYAVKLS